MATHENEQCTSCKTTPRQRTRNQVAANRFQFSGSALTMWQNDGVDDVGGVVFRDLGPCDEVVSVSASLIDSQGDPVTATADINIFMLPRDVDRDFGLADARTAAGWRALMQEGQREFRGGIEYAATTQRELTATNFGKGWPVGADWAQVSGRDNQQPPVLYILFRVLPALGAEFNASVVYRSCHK